MDVLSHRKGIGLSPNWDQRLAAAGVFVGWSGWDGCRGGFGGFAAGFGAVLQAAQARARANQVVQMK